MRRGIALACFVFLVPAVLCSQVTQNTEDRLRAMEERIRALEAEIRELKAGQAAAAPRAPQVPSAPAGAPPAGAAEVVQVPPGAPGAPAAQLPVYGGATLAAKVLNPDIGVIGNFVGAAGRNTVDPLRSLSLQESEVSLQAIVDPYARADFFLAIGEQGIEVEEGYVTFPALPGGFGMRAGRMRAAFGRVNTFHNHSLPWVDRPLVTFNLMGGSLEEADIGIKDAGISVNRILPSLGGIFFDATAEVYRGNSGSLFRAGRRSDIATVGRLRAYYDLSESTNLEIGGSYARGHNDLGSKLLTQLYGADITLRWKPLRRAIYRSFAARTELVWSRREEIGMLQPAFGWFGSAEYRLGRRWFVGGRYDWSQRARNAAEHDSGGSIVLTYWPSEFNQIRGQLRRTRYAGGTTANELLLQFLFTLGTHGAHPF